MSKECQHGQFDADVKVHRFEDDNRIVVELSLKCVDCQLPFQFMGLPLGLDLNGATSSIDGRTANLAMAPVGSVPQPLQVSGYSVGNKSFLDS